MEGGLCGTASVSFRDKNGMVSLRPQGLSTIHIYNNTDN